MKIILSLLLSILVVQGEAQNNSATANDIIVLKRLEF